MKIVLAACLFAIAAPVAAQTVPTSHDQAARELIQVLDMEKQHESSFETMLAGVGGTNPAMAEVHGLFMDFFKEFMSWKVLEPEFVRIYREAFSEADLRELTAFYKSPIGRKYSAAAPQLMKQSVAVSQKLMQQHMPELQRRIEAKMN